MRRKLALDVIRDGQQTIPVDVWAIASALGIAVRTMPMPQDVSGKIMNKGGSPATISIAINSSHHLNRQRFTLAHELAHYVLHRDQITEVIDNPMFRADEHTMNSTEEHRANQLAANILMPASKINECKAQGVFHPKLLAQNFGVSEEAMRIHIGQQVDLLKPRGAEFEDEPGHGEAGAFHQDD